MTRPGQKSDGTETTSRPIIEQKWYHVCLNVEYEG